MPEAFSIDYTSRDYEAIRDDMIRTIPFITDEWTDVNESDPGIVLIKLLAGALDVLHEYVDRAAAESFISTAVKRESIIKLLNLIGYELRGRVGAETIVEFSLDQPIGDGDIPVPRLAELETVPDTQSDEPKKFETMERVVLSGSPLVDPTGSNGEEDDLINVESASGFESGQDIFITSDSNSPITRTIDNVFYDTDIIQTKEPVPTGFTPSDNAFIQIESIRTTAVQGQTQQVKLGESDGTPDQLFQLSDDTVLEGSDQIIVDSGTQEEWEEVNTFSKNTENDKVYVSTKNTDDYLIYRFGDGNKAKIPKKGSDVFVRYRSGIGADGNIGENTLTKLNETVTFRNQPVDLNVTNIEPAVKGADRESKNEARINGPRELGTRDRAVIDKDYILLAEQVPGVAAVKAEPTDDGFGENVYVVLDNENDRTEESSDLLKDEVEDHLSERSRRPVNVLDPDYIDINVGGEIIYPEDERENNVVKDVQQVLDDFFEIGGNITGFETNIFMSDLIERLDNLDKVHHVNLEQLNYDPMSTLNKYEGRAMWSGSAEFSYIDTFKTTEEALWVVRFLGAQSAEDDTGSSVNNRFEVTQVTFDEDGCPIVNEIQETFLLDEELTIKNSADDRQISMLISSGQIPMEAGDIATFKTSAHVDNLIFEDKEFPLQGNNLFEFIELGEKLSEEQGQGVDT